MNPIKAIWVGVGVLKTFLKTWPTGPSIGSMDVGVAAERLLASL